MSKPDTLVAERRADVTRQWRELERSVGSETGLSMKGVSCLAGIAGLAFGLELSRRWFGRSGRRRGL